MEGRPRGRQTRGQQAQTAAAIPGTHPGPTMLPLPCPGPPSTTGGHLSVSAFSSVLSGAARGSRLVGPCGSVSPSSWGVSPPVGRGENSWLARSTLTVHWDSPSQETV